MFIGVIPFTWGTGAAGAGPAAPSAEQWVHPLYSRGPRGKGVGQSDQHGAHFGRHRADSIPTSDTFNDE